MSFTCTVQSCRVVQEGDDNTPTIQAAINYAEANGIGTVELAAGTYMIGSGPIVIHKPKLRVVGQGRDTVLSLPNGANDYIIQFSPSNGVRMDGVVIADMTLDCNGANQTAGGGINAFGASYCTFDSLDIKTPWGNGIELHEDNLGGFGHHNMISNNWIHLGANSNGGHGRALYIWNSDENMVVNNTFEANGSNLNHAAHIYETSGLNYFSGNMFVADPNEPSVEFLKVAGGNVIVGNIFDGGTNAQVELTGDDNSVSANRFYRPVANSDCLLVNGNGNMIVGNSFLSAQSGSGTSRSAVNASGASGLNMLSSNVIRISSGSPWSSGAVIGDGTKVTQVNNIII